MALLGVSGMALVRQAFAAVLRQPSAAQAQRAWVALSPYLAREITSRQVQAAWSGLFANAAALTQQGIYTTPQVWAVPNAYAGFSSVTGRSLSQQYALTGYRYIDGINAGSLAPATAFRYLGTMTHGSIADAGRDAVQADIIGRPKIAFVRMVNPGGSATGPCAMCVMLAGQIYWRDASDADEDRGGAFDRHDNCCCYHVPVDATVDMAEHYANGLADDPYAFFDSLKGKCGHSPDCLCEQNRVFSYGRAQAIRDGADIYSVMGSVDYRRQTYRGGDYVRRTGLTTFSMSLYDDGGNPTRLTPKGVYVAANGDTDLAMRLLRDNGYIIDRSEISGLEVSRGVVQPWMPKHGGAYGSGVDARVWARDHADPPSGDPSTDLMAALREAVERNNAQKVAEVESLWRDAETK